MNTATNIIMPTTPVMGQVWVYGGTSALALAPDTDGGTGFESRQEIGVFCQKGSPVGGENRM
jgi:hypothetical protein